MSDYNATFTAESMIPPPKRKWWQRLRDKLLRRPDPKPIQPEGTQPLTFDFDNSTGSITRMYVPAARLQETDPPEDDDPAQWGDLFTNGRTVQFDGSSMSPEAMRLILGEDSE